MHRLASVISKYSPHRIEGIALRIVPGARELPAAMWADSVMQVLTRTGHVERVIPGRRPPVLALLKTMLSADDHTASCASVREPVEEATRKYCRLVSKGELVGRDDSCRIYRRLLAAAWENNLSLDESETALLGLLRRELGMTQVEHFIMMHHRDIQPFWQIEEPFETVVSNLCDQGILFEVGDTLILPKELVAHVRKAIGITLDEDDSRRLYGFLSNSDLRSACEELSLRVAGSKADRLERLIFNLAPADRVLETLHIGVLKRIARDTGCRISGAKSEVIARLITHFDHDHDLAALEPEPEREPEPRALTEDEFTKLLEKFSGFQLRQVLARYDLPETGGKAKQIRMLCESGYSEMTLLKALKNPDLVQVLEKHGLESKGPKDVRIARLISSFQAIRDRRSRHPSSARPSSRPSTVR